MSNQQQSANTSKSASVAQVQDGSSHGNPRTRIHDKAAFYLGEDSGEATLEHQKGNGAKNTITRGLSMNINVQVLKHRKAG